MVERVKSAQKSALAAFNPLPVLQQSHYCGIVACGRVLRQRLWRLPAAAACACGYGSACGGLPAPLACGRASAGE
jgi:hypothetical protein